MSIVAPILLLALLPLMVMSYAQIWWGGARRGWMWFWKKQSPSTPMQLARGFFVLAESAALIMIIWPDAAVILRVWIVLLFGHIISMLLIQDKQSAR